MCRPLACRDIFSLSLDCVCLKEIYIASDSDSDLFRNLVAKATTTQTLIPCHGRLSEGVMVLARKEFLPFEKRMQVDVDNTVVLRIKKVYLKQIRM